MRFTHKLSAILLLAGGVSLLNLEDSEAFVLSSRSARYFHRIRHSQTTSCQVLLTHAAESNKETPPSSGNQTEVLWSYVYNLQRMRKQVSADAKQKVVKPARSLAYFLSQETTSDTSSHDGEVLSRAVVQALRLASDVNDYRLILQLVDAALHFANSEAVLEPRILGEAVRALGSSTASVGKIKSVWKLARNEQCWRQPVGALEVNAMLEALTGRGKLRAVLDLYRENRKITDAYSLSIIFNGLTESIEDNQSPAKNIPELKDEDMALHRSSCWQWNEALKLMEELETPQIMTNPVVSALLQLNERATTVYKKQSYGDHDGSRNALFLLDFLKDNRISPDQVTCTILLSSLQTEWKVALELLKTMHTAYEDTSQWSLPRPNVYIYSAVMSVCAKNQQYKEVWKLLDQVEKDPDVEPNTWVYNSVLQAIAKTARKRPNSSLHKRSKQWMIRLGSERMKTAFQLMERMEEGAEAGLDTAPDTVTYNTILSVLAAVAPYLQEENWNSANETYTRYLRHSVPSNSSRTEVVVRSLLDCMEEKKIETDASTYTHAIRALLRCPVASVFEILQSAGQKLGQSTRLNNAALSVLAASGNAEGVSDVVVTMQKSSIPIDKESTTHVINALGVSQRTPTIPILLDAIQGKSAAKECLMNEHAVNFDPTRLGPLHGGHYATAISACLLASDFENAREILTHMQDHDVQHTEDSLQAMARAYAVMSLSFTPTRKKRSADGVAVYEDSIALSGGLTRAKSAHAITMNIADPPAALLSLVAKACAATGLFNEAQGLLRVAHSRLLDHRYSETLRNWKLLRISPTPDENELILPDLHRTLLRSCAKWGNVTAALRLCEDIQYLSTQLSWLESHDTSATLQEKNQNKTLISTLLLDPQRYATLEPPDSPGMRVPEWKSLLVAAAKSGHWRVCLSTMQFLRPYLEETHPSRVSSGKLHKRLGKNYKHLCPALITAVACLCERGQYAWAERVIDDWMQWSGRRPPHRAVLIVARALSGNNQGEEVNRLLSRCSSIKGTTNNAESDSLDERILYVGVISALYNDGLYNAADDTFVAAVSAGILPFELERKAYGVEHSYTLDLHGMNIAVAHSAVRIALQQEVLSANLNEPEPTNNDIVIVTGRGRNSVFQMQPVLRPEVQRMLVEEFYPPLGTTSVPGNMGALRIDACEISAWLGQQRQMKGAQMLSLAAVLKNLTSGQRLKTALSKATASDDDQ